MATTIRLLSTYNGFKPQSIITVDDAIATQLIAGWNATTDLTGGVPAAQPGPNADVSTGSKVPAPQTITAGQTVTVRVPAGLSLSMQGSSAVVGTRQVLNPDGSVVSTDALAVGVDNTGVFLRDTNVKFLVTFGTLDVAADVTGGKVELDTLLAGEDLDFDVQRTAESADRGINQLPNRTDQIIGSIGAASDYLQGVLCVVSTSANSRVVLKEGTPSVKKALTTHGSTASTTTVLNTAINSEAVTADQFKDHLVRVGTGPYRKILTHAAFSAGAVNTYTLDLALPTAPGTNVAIAIEQPELVTEILPVGAPVGSTWIPVRRHCAGTGWRLSTDTGVSTVSSGKFDNV